jgi:polysaccharide deacetylase 2 family uncharacterized protein YibQ
MRWPKAAGRSGRSRLFRLGSVSGLLSDRPAMLAGLGLILLGAGVVIGAALGDFRGSGEAPAVVAPRGPVAVARPKPAPGIVERASTVPAAPVYEGPIYEEPISDELANLPIAEPEVLTSVRITDAPATTADASPRPASSVPARAGPAPVVSTPAVQQAAMPKVGGAQQWSRNAVLVPEVGTRSMIAIVIDDMGVDQKRSRRILDLPGPVTASYLTYAKDVREQTREARSKGKELLVHVPMEPESDVVDPGPDVLRTGMGADEVRRRVIEGLSRFDGYIGINNHMGSRFTADAAAMRPVIEELKKRGLIWLDSRTTARSAGADLARSLGVPYAERHVFLDHEESLAGVVKQLAEVERLAGEYGYAIAIGHPKDNTIEGLSRWLPTLEKKGLVLVPLSAIIRTRLAAVEQEN